MRLVRPVVLKYGGATVDGPERLGLVARDVIEQARGERPTVVVVSAMGNMTDDLIALARTIHPHGDMRAWQKLAAAGEDIAANAVALAIAEQQGRVVDLDTHQIGAVAFEDGRLKEIRALRLIKHKLGEGNIVVVPGYKGVTPDGTTMPLGRGASDLLAIALGGQLGVEWVFIKKDVDGMSPVDPDLVPDAIIFDELTYAQAIDVSDDTVIMDRALELAQEWHVPIRVMRSPSIGPSDGGTIIRNTSTPRELEPKRRHIVTLKAHRECSLVRVIGIPNREGQAHRVFEAVQEICLGTIIQDQGSETATISFTVEDADLAEVVRLVRSVHDGEVEQRDGYSALTLADSRMKKGTGYAGRVSGALAKAGVNIGQIAAPAEKIFVAFAAEKLQAAAMAVANEFGLRRRT